MTSNKKKARIAGLLYLVVVVTGIFTLGYVPSKLIIWNDPAITYANIVASQTLFRVSIVSGFVCYTVFLFLPLALYDLLESVNRRYARLMVILVMVSIPIAFANVQCLMAVRSLINDGNYLTVFTKEQGQTQAMMYLNQYDNGVLAGGIFWGLWLFPFGLLVVQSGILPRFLGVLLMLGCLGYLINFLGHSLWPDYAKLGIGSYVSLPASVGEIGTCLWLLIMGAKEYPNPPYKIPSSAKLR
ncbi:MAG: DUF4386 domain-containing protein [Spirosoma sp.]|nr:DUF4386 domain-containing protein [Spirosoma sp.]